MRQGDIDLIDPRFWADDSMDCFFAKPRLGVGIQQKYTLVTNRTPKSARIA